MRDLSAAAVLLAILGAAPLLAGDPVQEAYYPGFAGQLRPLEAGAPAPGTGLTAISEPPASLPEPAVVPVGMATDMAAPALQPPAEANKDQFFTLDELKGEMKKLAWTKGDFKVVPYGFLWATMNAESQRTFTGDYAMYVLSPHHAGESEPAFHVDGRSTRLGLNVSGPQIPCLDCAESGGKVEIDFQGSFVTENKAGLLLRHAYWEVKNDEFRLLAGQTWDVISPLYPGVLSYSVGWGGGNIGYRRAQFRIERYLAYSDELLFTVQGSANATIASDPIGNAYVVGDHSGWPILEGRLGTTLGPRGNGCKPIEFGVSGHIGELMYDYYHAAAPADPLAPPRTVLDASNVPERTWSFNVDVRIPIGDRWGFQGEFFTGENLGAFLGGALQGINVNQPLISNPALRRNTIRSTGGWLETWYDIRKDLHTHVGYAIDDPFNQDLDSGRTYNQFYFGNLVYDVTDKFLVGIELTQWKTLWMNKPTGDSFRCEFVAKYGF
jgi:hypothetical protein